ncbi:MAG: hydroxymethylbilane synthase [Dehalococcoidales bacterium]
MTNKIILGSRGSKLALIQSESIVASIKKANPDTEVSISRIVTGGDRNHHIPLEAVAGQGIFVKELEEALLDGRIDLAVHSLKDMPGQLPDGLCLAAVAERSDPRDVLISKGDQKLAELAPGATIGTGSLRRAAQLTAFRPDLEIISIRGNVDTRLNKITKGEVDGVILAAAALIRLGWEDRISEYLPVEIFLPAVGQGALAIETRSDDSKITRIVAPLNHLPTWQSITAERAFLRTLGGGCQAPMAASGTVAGTILRLEGMAIEVSENRVLRGTEEGSPSSAEELGVRLAQRLLADGADKFLSP